VGRALMLLLDTNILIDVLAARMWPWPGWTPSPACRSTLPSAENQCGSGHAMA